jgi:hypothetical protein
MAQIKMEMDSYNARVSIRTLYEATQLIRKGALTDSVIGAAYDVYNRDFNAYMAAAGNKPNLKHMFDWGMVGAPSGRLWKVEMRGRGASREVGYVFLPSRKKVPFDPENPYLKKRHVFKNKAMVFETGQTVKISPKYAKMLSYVNRHKGAGGTEGGGKDKSFTKNGVTFTTRTSTFEIASGNNAGQFSQEFVTFWAELGPIEKIASRLANETDVQLAAAASAKNRISNFKQKMRSAAPEARARAKRAIKTIERNMKKSG